MTNFSSSITFTKDNFDSENIIHKIEYKHTILSGNKLLSTSYKNKTDNNGSLETFNKLQKEGNNIYEKIGISQNKNSWNIKEFLNTILKKQYVDKYQNNNFNETILDAVINNVSINNKNLIQ